MVLPELGEKIYCSGILGAIQLVTGYYLILITKKEKIGSLLQKDVWKLKEIKMIAYRQKEEKELTESEVKKKAVSILVFTLFISFSFLSKNSTHNAK